MAKIFWIIRSLFLRPFFGQFGFPSYLGKPIFINKRRQVYIGNRVRIFPGSRMELLGSKSSITIGANTSIGQNIHLVSAGNLVIGLNTTISAYVMISNVDHTYAEIGRHILQQPHCFKETVVGDNCFIGYGAVVLAGTSLGRQCVIGANAVVRGEYPDYCVLVGAPAKVVRRYSKKTDTWEKTNAKGQFINEE